MDEALDDLGGRKRLALRPGAGLLRDQGAQEAESLFLSNMVCLVHRWRDNNV